MHGNKLEDGRLVDLCEVDMQRCSRVNGRIGQMECSSPWAVLSVCYRVGNRPNIYQTEPHDTN